MRRRLACLLLALSLVATASASASPRRPLPSHAQAVHALRRAEDLRAGRGLHSGFDLSAALRDLYVALPVLRGSDRTSAESLLARPNDNQADPSGTHKWSGPEDSHSPYCVAHFCIHWTKSAPDAPDLTDANHNQVPDYVEQMAAVFENEVFICENGTADNTCSLRADANGNMVGSTPGLGWTLPAPDNGLGGDDRLDVYISDLFPSSIFGYVAIDPGQTSDPSVPHYAYMVMDKDFSRFANGSAAGGLAEERVTAAHEYNHVLQNAYDYLEDKWMFESTAVWMEDKVYPDINDYLQYLPDWVANPAQPLTTFSNTNEKQYGSAVWNHWIDHRFGPGVVRSAWEHSVAAADFAPGAYDAAIVAAGGAGFSDEFNRFSAAVAEWQAPASGFPDRYPDVARNGSLPTGQVTVPFALPHTTFAEFDVPIPAGSPSAIRLIGTLPPGTSGAVALVGRTGGDPTAGTVTSNFTPLATGGTGGVILANPSSFGRITAIVINSDFAQTGFDSNLGDYVFAHDAPSVTAQLDAPGAPVVATGPAQNIADHSAVATASVDPRLIDSTWSIEYGLTTGYGSRTTEQTIPATTLTPAAVSATLTGLRAATLYHYRVAAANSGGQVIGGDMTFTTAKDVTPPTLVLQAPRRQRLRKVRSRGLLIRASANEPCGGTASIRLTKRAAKKLRLGRVLGQARVKLSGSSALQTIHVKLSRKARRRLSASGRLTVTVQLRVADPSHNQRTATTHVVLAA